MLFGFEANEHFLERMSWQCISAFTGISISGIFIDQTLHVFYSQSLLQSIIMAKLIFTATAILIQPFR